MPLQPFWISRDAPPDAFPDVESSLIEPNGLLAVGGDLSVERLLSAYRRGIFPWYSDGQPILWWSPDPRTVLLPQNFRISRSLKKTLRQGRLRVTEDQAFADIIAGCAAPRPDQGGTWLCDDMIASYRRLHERGHAHSLEVWQGETLVGGLYGVAMGKVFFGESMFSCVADASKVALARLCEMGYEAIDCQLPSAHLLRLGAVELSRPTFVALLDRWCEPPPAEFAEVRAR